MDGKFNTIESVAHVLEISKVDPETIDEVRRILERDLITVRHEFMIPARPPEYRDDHLEKEIEDFKYRSLMTVAKLLGEKFPHKLVSFNDFGARTYRFECIVMPTYIPRPLSKWGKA